MWFKWSLLTTSLLLSSTVICAEFEANAKVGADSRYFFEQGQYPEQLENTQPGFYAQAEIYYAWNNSSDSITFIPYYRYDNQDAERTHGDIRELSYIHVSEDWELRAGIRRVFWGVTEFQHLVDVINQTDAVEDIDGEDKLGQLMLNLSTVNDWGIVDYYLLPGFRERTFAGQNGRLRGPAAVDTNNAVYESSAGKQHVDLAVRWSHSIGDFDLGSYWFHGTNREPLLQQSTQEPISLIPYYEQMDQLGIDIQATSGGWLWKFESIYRDTSNDNFAAAQAGFEYTSVGILDSDADLGWLMEYAWDSRGQASESSRGADLQNDLFVGSRIALNDVQSSELLIGFRTDMEHHSNTFLIEANRRFGDNYKVSFDLRLFDSNQPQDFVSMLNNDDHIQLSVERYF
ncbi:hypothetical protein [Psychromonas aquimarina]|uniref:hypothetical protein n=1 Tax=Psychromonas aquimarina TaxID=444919 RepID=UPI00040F5ACA|nr:hypothetical protein [Psychromonas aquimarina]